MNRDSKTLRVPRKEPTIPSPCFARSGGIDRSSFASATKLAFEGWRAMRTGGAMIRVLLSALVAIGALIFLVSSSDAALAERRVALVVGNSQYKNSNAVLGNPRNDARDVSEVLRTLGFEVVLTVDADKREFDRSLQQFARLASDADAALFFFAGHAMQHQGRNYLMPIDAELEDEISLPYQMVSFDAVNFALDRAKGVKIIILDACRNNPVANRFVRAVFGGTRDLASARGLARIDKTQGMVVSYATGANEVAEDGKA